MKKSRVVLDTNVVFSAIISPDGVSADLFHMFLLEEIELVYSADILQEYRDVLSRHFELDDVNAIIEAIEEIGVSCTEYVYEREFLSPDPTDHIFFDAAMLASSYLVTWNLKHYPKESFILKPPDYLKLHR